LRSKRETYKANSVPIRGVTLRSQLRGGKIEGSTSLGVHLFEINDLRMTHLGEYIYGIHIWRRNF